jgi:hypothetical protein
MDTDFTLKIRIGFTIAETLLIDFKTYIKSDNTTLPKMITQFMFNYVEHLDSSFLKNGNNNHNKSLKTKHITLSMPENIYHRFKQKTEQEGIKINKIIEQFMRNYNNFMENCKR